MRAETWDLQEDAHSPSSREDETALSAPEAVVGPLINSAPKSKTSEPHAFETAGRMGLRTLAHSWLTFGIADDDTGSVVGKENGVLDDLEFRVEFVVPVGSDDDDLEEGG